MPGTGTGQLRFAPPSEWPHEIPLLHNVSKKLAILGNESDCCGGPELPVVWKLFVQEATSKARVAREREKNSSYQAPAGSMFSVYPCWFSSSSCQAWC